MGRTRRLENIPGLAAAPSKRDIQRDLASPSEALRPVRRAWTTFTPLLGMSEVVDELPGTGE